MPLPTEDTPSTPDTPTIPSVLPTLLVPFCFTGSHLVKGAFPRNISLLKRPQLQNPELDASKEILATWSTWWLTTQWASNATAHKPNWEGPARTGKVWAWFGEAVSTQDGQPYVYCYNCGLVLQHPNIRTIGNKHMNRHLRSQSCRQTGQPVHNHPNLPLSAYQPQQPRETPKAALYSAAAFETELVRLVIDNNLSFRTIERPSFRRFIQFLRPEAVITSRYKFGQMFQAQFKAAKEALLQDLHGSTKLSIALDAWTAGNHLSFLAIKGYYINKKWKLQEVLLDFIPMRGKHTGVSMAQQVLQVLQATQTTKRLLDPTASTTTGGCSLE
ncbi:hypothetical protein OPT61_g10047 [Boeremia exigua]|uniref:Uncharacterized protein n=1 Tax=Boeremia exigua TaxID=749465 RepID=A0ACC2HS49_9PLEO|nr:hypothetical protein OPT61_g10047 [Boeremia exigua]